MKITKRDFIAFGIGVVSAIALIFLAILIYVLKDFRGFG